MKPVPETRQARTIFLLTGLVLVVALASSVAIALAQPAPDHPWFDSGESHTLIIAHQGGDHLWPGNTLLAFQNATDIGVDVLEMDVHMTQDGVLVVMHDSTVDRTTNGSGIISDMTLDEIKTLDAGYWWPTHEELPVQYPFRDQGISVPTLEEVFTAFPDMLMNIEIKQEEPSIAAPFCDLIQQYGMRDRVLVASFHQTALDEFRMLCPEVATSATQNEMIAFYIAYRLYLAPAFSPDVLAFQVPEERFGLRIMTERFAKAAHSRNVDVHPWTINNAESMERLIGMGVDGIITDRPDILIEVLDESEPR